MESKQGHATRYIAVFVGTIAVVLVTMVTTLMVAKSLQPEALCGLRHRTVSPRTFPRNAVEWEPAETVDIPGKEYTVKKAGGECYIFKTALTPGMNRQLDVFPQVLDTQVVRSLAGEVALDVCAGIPVFLADDAETTPVRERRQAPAPAPAGGINANVNYDAPYNEAVNENRCMDKKQIINCAESANVGKTNACYTGVNGFFWMERTCKSETQIVVQMTKPPGRILKHMQKQAFLCEDRRAAGLRC